MHFDNIVVYVMLDLFNGFNYVLFGDLQIKTDKLKSIYWL